MRKPQHKQEASHPIEKLIWVMERLRDPDGGCPWDLEQDFKSIAPYTIEEAYEVADTIARSDMEHLREELGDLLLQPIYHAQMASEQNLFNIEDVIHDITEKMISRHPHVFGDREAQSAADVNKIWDERKAQEKAEDSALDGVAKALPALLRAQKLQKKAAKTGFEWKDAAPILDKLHEEIEELRAAVEAGDAKNIQEEIGDVLFVIVNFARINDVNSETALRECNDKFERRFKGMESDLKLQSKKLNDLTLTQMEQLWQDQKSKEKKAKP